MKKWLIIIGVVLVLVLGIFFYITNTQKNTSDTKSEGVVDTFLHLLPFGKNETTIPAENETSDMTEISNDTVEQGEMTLPRLRKLSEKSVAGATGIIKQRAIEIPQSIQEETVPTPTTEVTTATPTVENIDFVRYIEKATGNIYDIAVDHTTPTRITNTTIPRISEAYFANEGNNVLLRYLENDNKTIRTWSGAVVLDGENSLSRLAGLFLDDNITTLSVSPDGTQIFYMKNIGDITYGYISLLNGSDVRQIFDTSFSQWLSQWQRADTISLTTKATGYLEGYVYHLTTKGKNFKKILGPTFGLTTNEDLKGIYTLYSYTTAKGMQLRVYNETTGEQKNAPFNTFPEKCTWSKKETVVYCAVPSSLDSRVYPDDWYQGLYFSTDSIWRFDPNNGVGIFVADVYKEGGEMVDAINLGLTPDENMLYFTNKRDNVLWGISL
ncbi:MAG: hypothetical protein KBB88_02300 [Candidatus Pacebacteria bacterium]|nr:hypothetical protein [Candidatus Paceibacterota bacterium]